MHTYNLRFFDDKAFFVLTILDFGIWSQSYYNAARKQISIFNAAPISS